MKPTDKSTTYSFLERGGEMGKLTREYDWSTSPLGLPDQWPSSLRTLISMMLTSRFPMLIFWGPELITFYNDAFRPSLGNNGKHPSSLGQRGEQSWAEVWPVISPMIYSIMAGGEAVWFEDQKLPLYRDGQLGYAYWTYSYSPLIDDLGAINGILVTCSETTTAVESITQLKASNTELEQLLVQNRLLQQGQQVVQEQLQNSQHQLLASFEGSPVGLALISGPDLIFKMANSFYGKLVGRSPEELIDKPLLEAVPELSGQGFDALLRKVMDTGMPFTAKEARVELLRGQHSETLYVEFAYQPQPGSTGDSTDILVVVFDVTQQVIARRNIEESEARFRSLIEESPVGTCLYVGPQMHIGLANRIILEYWGKGDGVLGKPMLEVMPEMIGQPFPQLLDQVFTTGKPVVQKAARAELRVNGVMGVYYFDFSYKPLFDATGKVYAILDTAIDVTTEVIAHQKLEEVEVGLRGAVELAQLGTWSIDVATNGLTYSDRLIEWFGYDPAEQAYQEVIPIIQANDQERVWRAVAWALNPESDGAYDEEYTVIHPKTGQKRILRAQGKVVYDGTGRAIRMNGTAQDITIQRELQMALENEVQLRTEELAAANEELAASNEELEASNEEYGVVNNDLEEANSLLTRSNNNLQQFAYVASHDLQEPLRKIQQFGEILRSQYAEPLGSGIDYLNRMQLAANRMSTLIQDLLAYSRIATQREVNTMVDLMDVVAGVTNDLDLLIHETGAEITVSSLPTVVGDASQLRLLIQNLLTNALKFRRRNTIPVIAITGKLVTANQLPTTIKPARWATAYYYLQVSDNGIGFEEKYLDRIFQVFQRLHGKNEFAGTGIGLAICEKVVTNHGGAITATSQPGQGATFSVYLPM